MHGYTLNLAICRHCLHIEYMRSQLTTAWSPEFIRMHLLWQDVFQCELHICRVHLPDHLQHGNILGLTIHRAYRPQTFISTGQWAHRPTNHRFKCPHWLIITGCIITERIITGFIITGPMTLQRTHKCHLQIMGTRTCMYAPALPTHITCSFSRIRMVFTLFAGIVTDTGPSNCSIISLQYLHRYTIFICDCTVRWIAWILRLSWTSHPAMTTLSWVLNRAAALSSIVDSE